FQRIIAPERFRVDVDLHGADADLRTAPKIGRHAAGRRADEADEARLRHCEVRALARIGPDYADRERMIARDDVLAVERGRNWDRQCFRKLDELRRGPGSAHAAARDDHRALGSRPPVNASTGEWARNASRRPAARLRAPTCWAMQMPGLPQARA